MRVNPADLSFLRYVGPPARWWDWAVERWRHIRPGAVIIADKNDLKKSSVQVITRGKGFTVDLRRRDLQELPSFTPPAGDRSASGQLFVTPKDRKAMTLYRALMTARANPILKTKDGSYYTLLPRRYVLRGKPTWWLGPFRVEAQADVTAGLARRDFARVDVVKAKNGYHVGIAGGFRLIGPPRIGPFDTSREAGAVLGKLQPRGWQPVLAEIEDVLPARGHSAARTRLLPAKPAYEKVKAQATLDEDEEAAQALRSLGYSITDARQAVQDARGALGVGAAADTESIIRQVFRDAHGARANPRSEQCPSCGRRLRVPRTALRLTCPHCRKELNVS